MTVDEVVAYLDSLPAAADGPPPPPWPQLPSYDESAIRAVAEKYIDPTVADRLAAHFGALDVAGCMELIVALNDATRAPARHGRFQALNWALAQREAFVRALERLHKAMVDAGATPLDPRAHNHD